MRTTPPHSLCATVLMMFLSAALAACFASNAQAQEAEPACGNFAFSGYGPFDYRTATAEQRSIVERNHFSSDVETLRAGLAGTIGTDLSYVLRAFPNHSRALASMAHLTHKDKTQQPAGSAYTLDCWFDRAIRFAPDDAQIRLVVGVELLRQDRYQDAIEQLQTALKLGGDSANAHYNLGLAYIDTRQYDLALQHAHKAYQMGFPLPGLRDKLKNLNQWTDPPATTP